MVKVEDTDLEQTVIVVTHPRAKRVGGPQSHVTVLTPGAPLPSHTSSPGNLATPQHETGEPRDRVWLLDQHPNIHAGMSRRDLRPGWDWQQLADQRTSDWKCWKFIQNWRVFTHALIRMKFMRRCWHHLGDLLKLWVARREGRQHHLMDEPIDFPNAWHIDRQAPAASSGDPRGSAESTKSRRHRIMRH